MKACKVAIIGIVGLPANYGGFETLAEHLLSGLRDKFSFTVYCSGRRYRERKREYLGARLKYLPLNANGPESIIYDFVSLLHSAFSSDVLLVLGVSGGILLPFLRWKRVILNIGGLDWDRSKWGWIARHWLRISEAMAVRSADVLIADNQGIADYLQRAYDRQSVLIEYGGDHVSLSPITDEKKESYPFLGRPYCFSVARVQPDNNIETILDAFAQSPEHKLVFVGNWRQSKWGRKIKRRYGSHPNIQLLEAIYDVEMLNVLRGHCELYIHGHSAGGTNPSLVEAMHLRLPIVAFDVVYNRATTEGHAKFFKNATELAKLLRETAKAEWEAQRRIMKEIADRRYRWATITDKYAQFIASE